jgi:uncharacterized protein
LDGCDYETNACRPFSNQNSAFDQVLAGLRHLQKYNSNINALGVLTRGNFQRIERIIDFFVENGLNIFAFNYLIPAGRADRQDSLALTCEELFETTVRMDNAISKWNARGKQVIERNLHYYRRSLQTGKKEFMCHNAPCGAALSLLGVSPNGDIYPCNDFAGDQLFHMGNISDDSLDEILGKYTLKRYFMQSDYSAIEGCSECDLKDLCFEGCPARRFYANGSIRGKSPLCDFYKKLIPYMQSNNL